MRARLSILATLAIFALPAAAQNQPPRNEVAIHIEDFVKIDAQGVTTVQDPDAGPSFQLPPGWLLESGFRWGNHETTLHLIDAQSHIAFSMYYQCPIQVAPPPNLEVALYAGMDSKVKQRQIEGGLKNYTVRKGSVQFVNANGHPALSFIGDFTPPRGQPMAEFMTRVASTGSKAEFFVTLPAAMGFNEFLNGLGSIVNSLRIP